MQVMEEQVEELRQESLSKDERILYLEGIVNNYSNSFENDV